MARKGRGRRRSDFSIKRVPRCVGHRKYVPSKKVGVSDFLCFNLCLVLNEDVQSWSIGLGGFHTYADFSAFFTPPPPLARKIMQPRLLSLSTTPAFGPTPPSPSARAYLMEAPYRWSTTWGRELKVGVSDVSETQIQAQKIWDYNFLRMKELLQQKVMGHNLKHEKSETLTFSGWGSPSRKRQWGANWSTRNPRLQLFPLITGHSLSPGLLPVTPPPLPGSVYEGKSGLRD